MTLTESFAMLPGASVSGYYFWRPEAAYFGLRTNRSLQSWRTVQRKGSDIETMSRWLASNLDDAHVDAGAA